MLFKVKTGFVVGNKDFHPGDFLLLLGEIGNRNHVDGTNVSYWRILSRHGVTQMHIITTHIEHYLDSAGEHG